MIAYREHAIARNVRAWLPHARKIIVVVGATSEVEKLGLPATDPMTAASARNVVDPEHKIIVIERNGFWPDKNAMIEAAEPHLGATIVWQVDADEFYMPAEIERARQELSDSTWQLAAMPHILYWKDTRHRLVNVSNPDWKLRPPRIWRRIAGELHMHLPYATIRNQSGEQKFAPVRNLEWGRCHHAAWIGDDRVRFRMDFHKSRGAENIDSSWFQKVWKEGHVPTHGVHPAVPGLFPHPYNGPVAPPLR